MIKAIVTDLDGTLLRSDKSISEYTLNVLEKCRAQGIVIGAATARSENSAKRYIELIKPEIIISNGGAKARCFGETVYESMLAPETVSGIIKMCMEAYPDGDITVEAEDGYYWNYKEKPPTASDYAYAVYNDYSNFDRSAYKITAELENEADMHRIAAEFPDCSCIGFSGEIWRRFASRKAEKAFALEKISERLGISVENIAAFGDDFNGVEMLKYCGTGVAMGNAVEEAKQAADFVCDTNDNDGLAKFIEENFLKEQHNAENTLYHRP